MNKSINILFTLLSVFGACKIGYSQTTIDFDNASKWTAGSGVISGYQLDHKYEDAGWLFTGGEALRQTTTVQDAFPGANGTYSWRLNNNSSVNWTSTHLSCGTLTQFGFKVRRWDDSPSPNYDVSYSLNGGSSFTSVHTINNTSLSNSSDWTTYSYSIPSGNQAFTISGEFIVRIKANGGTERIMIDDFTFTKASLQADNVTGVSNTSISGNSTTISWTNPSSTFNNIVVIGGLSSITTSPEDCVDPTSWSSSSDWNNLVSVNSQMGLGATTEYVLYVGTGNSVIVSNLPNTGNLNYKVFTQLNPWSSGVSGSTPLPVELIQFDASKRNEAIVLNWATASELNNSHFDIEKSVNGIDFVNIGRVAGAGNSNEIKEYSYTDRYADPINYYRLKQVDFDGEFEYSQVIKVLKAEEVVDFNFRGAKLAVRSVSELQSRVLVISSDGKLLEDSLFEDTILLSTERYRKGTYFVTVFADGKAFNYRLVK